MAAKVLRQLGGAYTELTSRLERYEKSITAEAEDSGKIAPVPSVGVSVTTNSYHAGFQLQPNSPFYVERHADHQVWASLQRMEYVMLVAPRQQGKTSLISHLAQHCQSSDYVLGYVDLAQLDTSTERGWYWSLHQALLHPFDSVIAGLSLPDVTGSSTWFSFLHDVAQIASSFRGAWLSPWTVLTPFQRTGQPTSLPRSAAFMFTERALQCFRNLSFVVAGALDPRDMIRETAISSFNLASRIPLEDFTLDELKQLVGEYLGASNAPLDMVERLYYWTGGQPYLCMKLSQYLADMGGAVDARVVDTAD